MKKLIIPCILLCMTLLFAGCGSAVPAGTQPGTAPAAGPDGIARTTYNVGSFTVDIPEGWEAFPQEDILAETAAPGEQFPMDPTYICLSDYQTTETGLHNFPYVSIRYYAADEEIPSAASWYDNVTELSLAIQGTECTEALLGDSKTYESTTYEHILWETDKGSFVIEFPTVMSGRETGYSHDDEKIKIILESINNPSKKQ